MDGKSGQEPSVQQVIDGKAIAKNIRSQVAEYLADIDEKPRLAVIQVGNNAASAIYVRNKLKACREAGIDTVSAQLDAGTSEESLLGLIEGFNSSPAFTGILVQLPLPPHINSEKILESIDPLKDVDGFHPVNVGRLTVRSSGPYLHPCTPWGIVHMLDTVYPKKDGVSGMKGMKAVVIGQSLILGRPLSVMLQNEGATVTMCDVHTRDLNRELAGADIVISATGVAGLINRQRFEAIGNPDVTIIDAGIARVDGKTVGDIDQSLYAELKSYSPVPGGVGPVTVAFLLRNVAKAFAARNGDVNRPVFRPLSQQEQ